ncbi:MAG: translation elongation factor-like protein [Elusimicrobiota bacterium]
MDIKIGVVDDYFAKVGVIALKLQEEISVGDTIKIKRHSGDLIQKVESMQVEHQSVTTAKRGDNVGIKISDKAHKGNEVYKVIE